jgi:F0F1-type ATP synthase membrane subunit a
MMILAGLLLAVALPLLTHVHIHKKRGGVASITEVLYLFVQDHLAKPALGAAARPFVPFLATLLCFLLAMNLLGLLPLIPLGEALAHYVPALHWLHDMPIGGSATGSIFVTGVFAAMTFAMVILLGYFKQVRTLWKGPIPVAEHMPESGEHPHEHHRPPPAGANLFLGLARWLKSRRWPLPVAVVAGVYVWLNSFVPSVPGIVGLVLWPMLLVLEVAGTVTRCFALCIRLFANMTSGHLLIAVLVMFAAMGSGWSLTYISLPSVLGSLFILTMEILVAVIQAYIFVILTAVYIGLAISDGH